MTSMNLDRVKDGVAPGAYLATVAGVVPVALVTKPASGQAGFKAHALQEATVATACAARNV